MHSCEILTITCFEGFHVASSLFTGKEYYSVIYKNTGNLEVWNLSISLFAIENRKVNCVIFII